MRCRRPPTPPTSTTTPPSSTLLASLLPALVKEAFAPLGAIDITKRVAGNVTEGMQLASDVLGIDLPQLFQRLAGGERGALAGAAPAGSDGGSAR